VLSRNDYASLSVEVVLMAIMAGKGAYETLKLLEVERGIIMDFTIDRRNDTSVPKGQKNIVA
jgi:hypothetical protein